MKRIQNIKSFIYIWIVIFLILGIYPSLNFDKIQLIFIFIAFVIYVIYSIDIGFFNKIYDIWMKLAGVLGKVSSTFIMFFLYFFLFTPISLILKLLSKDLLKKNIDKKCDSYWLKRESQPQSMKNQF